MPPGTPNCGIAGGMRFGRIEQPRDQGHQRLAHGHRYRPLPDDLRGALEQIQANQLRTKLSQVGFQIVSPESSGEHPPTTNWSVQRWRCARARTWPGAWLPDSARTSR